MSITRGLSGRFYSQTLSTYLFRSKDLVVESTTKNHRLRGFDPTSKGEITQPRNSLLVRHCTYPSLLIDWTFWQNIKLQSVTWLSTVKPCTLSWITSIRLSTSTGSVKRVVPGTVWDTIALYNPLSNRTILFALSDVSTRPPIFRLSRLTAG